MTESTQVKKYPLITTHKIFSYIIQIKHMKTEILHKEGGTTNGGHKFGLWSIGKALHISYKKISST